MKFKVNNFEWEMEFADEDTILLNKNENVILGLTEYIAQTISIRKGMTEQMTRRTVIHELCHCFLFSFGFCAGSYDEEAVCNFFEGHADAILQLTNEFMMNEERCVKC